MLEFVILLIAASIIIVGVINSLAKFRQHNENQNVLTLCENPGCIRCNKNEKIKQNALTEFQKVQNRKSLNRLKEAFALARSLKSHLFYCNFLTKNIKWSLKGLPQSYKNDLELLVNNIPIFKKEFEKNKLIQSDLSGWSKFFMMNQGTLVQNNIKQSPDTYNILKQCHNTMTDCLFGYQFFSVLSAGSVIEEHQGPTNIRLRCHISIQIPDLDARDTCLMEVDGRVLEWKKKDFIMFDDSLIHKVVYKTNTLNTLDRVVLLVDFWHPDLTTNEKDCLKNCFPC